MKDIRDLVNDRQYRGKYIAVGNEGKVIAVGKDPASVLKKAGKKRFISDILVFSGRRDAGTRYGL